MRKRIAGDEEVDKLNTYSMFNENYDPQYTNTDLLSTIDIIGEMMVKLMDYPDDSEAHKIVMVNIDRYINRRVYLSEVNRYLYGNG